MSESIIIAETNKGTIAQVTAELVSAAIALGTSPTVVVPCVDPAVANDAGYDEDDWRCTTRSHQSRRGTTW